MSWRWGSALGLLVALLASPVGAGTLIVANKSDASVSLFDPDSGEELAVVAVGQGPHEVAVSPDGKLAVVSNYGTGEVAGSTLSVIDVAQAEVTRTIDLGEHTRPHGVEFHDDNRTVIVTTEGSESVVWVDAAVGEIVGHAETGEQIGHMVAMTPDERRAFVPNIRSGTLTVLDLIPRSVSRTLSPGRTEAPQPEGVAVSPDGEQVWVTNRAEGTVAVYDTASLEKLRTLECPGFPIRVLFTPDGRFAVVSCAIDGEVAVFEWRSGELVGRTPMLEGMADDQQGRMFAGRGPMPIGVASSPDSKWLFVSNTNADTVTVIDMGTLEIARRIETRKEPDGIAWSEVEVEVETAPNHSRPGQ